MAFAQAEGGEFEAARCELLDRFSAAINGHIEVGASIGQAGLALRQLEVMVADMELRTERMEERAARVLGTGTRDRREPAGTGG